MRFYPCFCYENGDTNEENKTALSIQSVLTQCGRICFVTYAAVANNKKNDGKAKNAVETVTSWFWQQGVVLLCQYAGNSELYRSVLRMIDNLADENTEKESLDDCHTDIQINIAILTENKAYIWQIGSLFYTLICQTGLFQKKRMIKNLACVKGSFRKPIYRVVRYKKLQAFWGSNFYIDNYIRTMKQDYLNEKRIDVNKMEKRLKELGKRVNKGKGEDICLICILIMQ